MFEDILPKIEKVKPDKIQLEDGCHLILVLGFEERATTFIEKISSTGIISKVSHVTLIEYLPYKSENDRSKKLILQILENTGVDKSNIKVIHFNRSNPLEFDDTVENFETLFNRKGHIYIDISAMSKMLMLYLLKMIYVHEKSFTIIYTEAKEYAPKKSIYQLIKDRESQNLNDFFPIGVFDPFVPPMFSGYSPLGVDRILVTFLSFNKRQSLGVSNIIPYQMFIPIIGVPPKKSWEWRVDAMIDINDDGLLLSEKMISEIPQLDFTNEKTKENFNTKDEYSIKVSTFDYSQTVELLFWINEKHRYRHFITIAPFGSKMQTFGVFLYTLIHNETQIVYASPQNYYKDYSIGSSHTYKIDFFDLESTLEKLKEDTDPNQKILNRFTPE